MRTSPVVAADGSIAAGSTGRDVRSFVAQGTERWRFDAGVLGEVWSTPAILANGSLVVGTDRDRLVSLAADGALRWEFLVNGNVRSSPVVAIDGTIVVGSDDGNIYAVTATGAERWRFVTGGPVRSSPATDIGGTVFVPSGDGNLYALALQDGQLVWQVPLGARGVSTTPLVTASGSVIVTGPAGVRAVSAQDGHLLWQFAIRDGVRSSPALGLDGTLYVGADDGFLYAIRDGRQLWRFATGAPITSSPTVGVDGIVYVAAIDGVLFGLTDAGSSAKVLWSLDLHAPVDASSPALGPRGMLYVGTDRGEFVAVGERRVPPTSLCASTSDARGQACGDCACAACYAELTACMEDRGCRAIFTCAAQKRCVGRECDAPDACRSVIRRFGGRGSPSADAARLAAECGAGACAAECGIEGPP